MNVMQQAQRAYSGGTTPIKTDRQVEYEIFAKVTRMLKVATAQKHENYAAFVDALHKNRQLWNLLAVDVVDQGNSLPPELRAQIFFLAEFTEKHTPKVLRNEEDASVLAELNLTIMRGLNPAGEI